MIIARRFRGPPQSGNGGYSCGMTARELAGPCEVTLRAPPPLDRELSVARRGPGVVVRDGEAVIAEAAPAEVAIEVPAPVTLAQAEEASIRSPNASSADTNARKATGCASCPAQSKGGRSQPRRSPSMLRTAALTAFCGPKSSGPRSTALPGTACSASIPGKGRRFSAGWRCASSPGRAPPTDASAWAGSSARKAARSTPGRPFILHRASCSPSRRRPGSG